MARLRLFANLREIAGTSKAEFPGDTVDAVVNAAGAAYGEQFHDAAGHAGTWVNGDPATGATLVSDTDEVALIPPVSGGAGVMSDTPVSNALLVGSAVLLLALANTIGSVAVFAAVAVGVISIWALDLQRETATGGLDIQLPPIFASIVAAALAVTGMADRFSGFGLALVFALISGMVWALSVPDARHLTTLSATLVVQIVAAGATGGLMLARLSTDGERIVGILLIQIVVAGLATWLATQLALPFLDPYVLGAVGAILAGLLAAWLWDQTPIWFFLLEGAVVAMALIAGRGFGAVCRTGEVYLVDRPPGMLSDLDGPLLAAALFVPILRLVG